jgi:hypothetical protein
MAGGAPSHGIAPATMIPHIATLIALRIAAALFPSRHYHRRCTDGGVGIGTLPAVFLIRA